MTDVPSEGNDIIIITKLTYIQRAFKMRSKNVYYLIFVVKTLGNIKFMLCSYMLVHCTVI